MTAPKKVEDVARLLGAKVSEVYAVGDHGDASVVTMAHGVIYRIEADGSVLYQVKPNPELTYSLPVYEAPEEEDLVADDEGGSGDAPAGVPEGSIPDVVAWVRGAPEDEDPADGWPERAAEALAVEQAKGDKARATLVAQLEDLVADDEGGSGDGGQ